MATQQQTVFSNQALLLADIPSIEKLSQQPIEAVYASTNRIINLSVTLCVVMIALLIPIPIII